MNLVSNFLLIVTYLFVFLSCSKDSLTIIEINKNDLEKLKIKYIGGMGYSNLMPPTRPDPVFVKIELQVKNTSETDTIRELYFENFRMFLTTDSLLGKIEMMLWYDIDLKPSCVDTVILGKIHKGEKIFEPPCREYFYLDFYIKDKYDNFLKIKTDSIYCECDA